MKPKLALATIVSTAAIASAILLASGSSAQPCSLKYTKQYEQTNWLRSPLAAVITLPGIAIAAALSLGGRYYKS